jgi:hypothetical protein
MSLEPIQFRLVQVLVAIDRLLQSPRPGPIFIVHYGVVNLIALGIKDLGRTARDNALASCVCAGCCGRLELRARRRQPARRALCPRPQVMRCGLYQRPEPPRGVGVLLPATWLDAALLGSLLRSCLLCR